MRQSICRHLIVTYAISLGLMIAYISLLQPIPSVSAQQLTGSVSQGTSGTGTTGRRIENIAPRKPHQLIRKPQNPPIASVEPSPSSSSPASSLPTPLPSPQSDNTTSQSKDPSSLNRSVGAAVPLATMSVTPSSATTTGSIATGTASTGTIPLAKQAGPLLNLRKRKYPWAIDEQTGCGDAGVGTIDVAACGPSSFSQPHDRSESDQSVLYSPARGQQSHRADPEHQQHRRRNLDLDRQRYCTPGCRSVRPRELELAP